MKSKKHIKSFDEHQENSNIYGNIHIFEKNHEKLEVILDTNTDWNIELEHKKTREKVVICNYMAATHGASTYGGAINYPIDDENADWLSRKELIDNYIFVRSWTPDDVVEHIKKYREINKKRK
jgi:transcription antitermination factor NusG